MSQSLPPIPPSSRAQDGNLNSSKQINTGRGDTSLLQQKGSPFAGSIKQLSSILSKAPALHSILLKALPSNHNVQQNPKALASQIAGKLAGTLAEKNSAFKSESLQPLLKEASSVKVTTDSDGFQWRSWLLNWNSNEKVQQFHFFLRNAEKFSKNAEDNDKEKDKKEGKRKLANSRFALLLNLSEDIGPIIIDGWVQEDRKQIRLVISSHKKTEPQWQKKIKENLQSFAGNDGWTTYILFQTVDKLAPAWLDKKHEKNNFIDV